MGQKRLQRTRLYKQRIAETLIADEITNIKEERNFKRLIKQGIIVPENGTIVRQKRT
jgi:hypothetical protein